MWYIPIMEYYLAMKRNELLVHVTIWMNLENIVLNERNQSQKTTYYMIPFICSKQSSVETETRLVVGWGWKGDGEGVWEVTAKEYGVSFME